MNEKDNKKAVEILRWVECLENIDDDIAEAVIRIIGDLQDEKLSAADLAEEIQKIKEESFKAGQESNDCIICNEKDDNMSCQLCIGKQIKKSQQEERERIVKIIKPIIILLNRIEKGNYFDEDDEELMWKKAFKELKSKLEA